MAPNARTVRPGRTFDRRSRMDLRVWTPTPAAAEVAKASGAKPCSKPARAGLGLLAGDEGAWPILFHESAS